jgi:hypothetical protein
VGVAEDIVISMVVFLFLSLRNTDGTVFQGANSLKVNCYPVICQINRLFVVFKVPKISA